MIERPIIMSAPMISAILAGRKRQTRRLLREDTLTVTLPRMVVADVPGGGSAHSGEHSATMNKNGAVCVLRRHQGPLGVKPSEFDFVCPYASGVTRIRPDRQGWEIVPHPGQRLWVREKWRTAKRLDPDSAYAIAEQCRGAGYAKPWAPVVYADGEERNWDHDLPLSAGGWGGVGRARSSIHMPRWACRLVLEVTAVRIQRLNDISADDAISEGLRGLSKDGGRTVKYGIPDRDGLPGTDNVGWPWDQWCQDPRDAFARLWGKINAKRAPWESNPWVWALSFDVVDEKAVAA